VERLVADQATPLVPALVAFLVTSMGLSDIFQYLSDSRPSGIERDGECGIVRGNPSYTLCFTQNGKVRDRINTFHKSSPSGIYGFI
jgi:hypothetical protein